MSFKRFHLMVVQLQEQSSKDITILECIDALESKVSPAL